MNALIFVTTPPSRKATTNTQIPVAQEKADAANDAAAADANDLNVSMNRGERLKPSNNASPNSSLMPILKLQLRCLPRRKRRMLEIPWMHCVCKARIVVRNWKANRISCNPMRRNRPCKRCFFNQKSMMPTDSTHSNRRMRLAAPIPVSPHFGNELGRSVSDALESVGE